MFLSLQNDLRNELRNSFSNHHSRIDQVEEYTEDLERLISEHFAAYNEIADAHDHQVEEIRFLQAKVADLEDRSRRNNIKFRGIPETVKAQDQIPYIQQLFLKLLPHLHQAGLIIDRAHEIAKPNHLPASVPLMLVCIHFFHTKEHIMAAA